MSDETLLDFQIWFASIITRPFREIDELYLPVYDEATIRDIEAKIPETQSLRAHQRIGLYHQQYWWRLFVLLQESYPTLLCLFGHTDFNAKIAEPYFVKHPPTDWFLPRIGNSLPAWIRAEYSGPDRPLVLQVAEVEEAYERLLHAPSLPPVESDALDVSLPIQLQPFVEIFSMNADFFAFRSKLLEQEPAHWLENDFPELAPKKCFFVLHRLPSGLQYREISEAEYLLLSGFKKGATIKEACSDAKIEDTSQDIAEWFKEWADLEWFVQEIGQRGALKKRGIRGS